MKTQSKPVHHRDAEHGLPMVFLQVRNASTMYIPMIQVFCNRHPDCESELNNAIRRGAKAVPSTYWYERYAQ